jgi:transposase
MSLSGAGTCLSAGDGEFWSVLLPELAGAVVEQAGVAGDRLVLRARPRAARARCPRCGVLAVRRHSQRWRRLAGPAIGGRAVVIWLVSRRFFCAGPCGKATFTEQVEGLTSRYARRSPPLRRVLEAAGAALAGRAGARLAAVLGTAVDRTSLLRLVMALPDPPAGDITVLGIDDFAFRRGQSYGTIVINMETGRPVDVLPDREAATAQAWLEAHQQRHPPIEVICRDRAGAYAQAARDGAGQAAQVADRWHLWHNLCEHTARAVRRLRPDLAAAQPGPAPAPAEADLAAIITARHQQVQAIRAAGGTLDAAAAALGLGKSTAQRYWRAATAAALLDRRGTALLDPWKPYLRQRLDQGITRAAVLHREITAAGFAGSYQTLYRWTAQYKLAAPPPPAAPLTARQITSLLLRNPARLDDSKHAQLTAITAASPALAALARHTAAFAQILTGRHASQLDQWIAAAASDDGQPELRSFTAGLQQDIGAVRNALTMTWSNGRTEGAITRLKLIKRQMYGRASFQLLRKRVLLASTQPP